MNETILVVEDEPRVVRLITTVLTAVGYATTIARDGEQALERVALEPPDLVLLDIMLPRGLDGYAVCRRLREFSDVPIIILTAKAQEDDVVRGFDAGADDYLTKPFSAKELVARVKALLRRAQRPEETVTAMWRCGALEINFARHSIRVQGQEVKLTRTEYALLRELALNANRVLSHQDLLTKIWGPEYRDDVDYLRVYIRYLRRKLEADPTLRQSIQTVSGVGYMLVCAEI